MQVIRCRSVHKQEILNLSVIIGRGGEACIYAVPSDDNLVAKVYHKPTLLSAEKLQTMLANRPTDPTANMGHISIAWPLELLETVDGSKNIIGFLMPKIERMRPIVDFYNPRTRRQYCPLFNYRYLLRTARNLASTFVALHTSGYCIGDINESNILVSNTALVTLVDTDSFQVKNIENNQVYRCFMGKPEYTPPELQNKTFGDYDRETYHDLFGLGVLIFQLLMEGTHPYSGIFKGIGDPPGYEARIAAGHFTYSQNKKVPYAPTPIAPAWKLLHPNLQELFLNCFEKGHDNPQLRPTAQTWLSTLADIEETLLTCSNNTQHWYYSHLQECPWCQRTSHLKGRDPFPSVKAIINKQHLQPHLKLKHQKNRTPKIVKPYYSNPIVYNKQPVTPQYTTSVKTNLKTGVTKLPKTKVYGMIFIALSLGIFGYLDLMIKFTRPFISANPYTEQNLISSEKLQKSVPENLANIDYYQQGDIAYKQKDYQLAIAHFSQAVKKNPQARGYVNLGNARYNLSDYQGALAEYNQALKLNPQEIKAYVNRGNTYYMLADYSSNPDEKYRQAIADFNQALTLDQYDTEAYIRRGIVRFELTKYLNISLEEYHNAIADFTKAIKINSSKVDAYFQRGLVRYQLAQYSSNYLAEYKQVIEDFTQAIKINPRIAKLYIKRAMVYYDLAQYDKKQTDKNYLQAIADLQTAEKISLVENDIESYQESLSNMCMLMSNRCDSILPNLDKISGLEISNKFNMNR
ncbi:tetratricopeptide repeat protein [Anabaena sp. FACHB-1237]|uniref:tetratricopeptide repeat protein n=1 Tax=Anabaena sp. FACHB-1237 TaxID=2692769 RepID=UPI001680633A|nr:tetratricopeptide repeat protein [Anabaena sp. FACHB-1237]MBD2138565.1 tetratricopeptide repeat protein [Anabaena sp. FACHB-1237]